MKVNLGASPQQGVNLCFVAHILEGMSCKAGSMTLDMNGEGLGQFNHTPWLAAAWNIMMMMMVEVCGKHCSSPCCLGRQWMAGSNKEVPSARAVEQQSPS